MKNRTITVIVPTSSELVFGFLSKVENLPLWATEFCQSVRRDGTTWKVQTPQGEMFFDIHADKQTGVLDMMAGSGPDDLDGCPFRVIDLTNNQTAITCTLFQKPGTSDALFAEHQKMVEREMDGLSKRFGGCGLAGESAPLTTMYCGFVVADPAVSREYYARMFGFQAVFSAEFYVHLIHPQTGAQLGFLKEGMDQHQPLFSKPVTGVGMWLSIDVTNADDELERLNALGANIVQPAQNQPWGERNFVVRDPNGVLIYIAQKIPADAAFMQCYATDQAA